MPYNRTINSYFTGNLTLDWELIKGLTFKSTFGSQMTFNKVNRYLPSSLPSRVNSGNAGMANVDAANTIMVLNENTLNYNKDFGTDHNFNAVIGTSYQTESLERFNAEGQKYYADPLLYNNLGAGSQATFKIGSGETKYAIFSYLARFNYTYKNKYLLTLTGRSDASSRFAANHKRAFFPAAAIAWNASNEDFIKNLNVFDNLKIRASYGSNGSQGIDTYQSLASLRPVIGYLIGGTNIVGFTSDRLPNPDLTWETTKQFDAGIEFSILKKRVNVELDYYNKVTSNLLLNQQLATQSGYSSKVTNIGSINNHGLELAINTDNIVRDGFSWSTTLNIAANRNKVLDLGGVQAFDNASTGYGTYSTISRLIVGQPVGTFWGTTYVGTKKTDTPPTGTATSPGNNRIGDALYQDLNGDGKIDVADYHVIGNSNPKFYGGLGNTFTYKKFSLNVFFQGSYGNQVMNISDNFNNSSSPGFNQYASVADRWTVNNQSSDIPRLPKTLDYIYSSRSVYDGSFLRLRTATIGFNLTGSDMHVKWIQKLNVYVTGTNLWLWTKYPYYDPEVNSYGTNSTLRGFDYTDYPQNRTFILGLNLTL